jgi:antitoxin component of MazEF toxin-antitoxin module
MITKIQKWGNSQGLRLSKDLLSDADIDVGDAVDVAVHKGALIVTPFGACGAGTICGHLSAVSRSSTNQENSPGALLSVERFGRWRSMSRGKGIWSP